VPAEPAATGIQPANGATPRPRSEPQAVLSVGRAPVGTLRMTWLIARRAAVEALQDRFTLVMSLFFVIALPIGLVTFIVRPQAEAGDPGSLGVGLSFSLLTIGLLPALSAVGIASGQFAGEHERGVLVPLLASPASNLAIFGGKVLGAVIPPLIYALVAELVYLLSILLVLGPGPLAFLSPPVFAAMLVLVPAVTCLAAIIASLIASRVRTFNAAQQLAGLALGPVLAVILAGAARLLDTGGVALFAAILGLLLLDLALAAVAAATWQREEVLSRR
jgi:ABC-type Na+ efflux pump permease subunit